MAKTYTYTARSAENPDRVVTFTLRDKRMSVGVGAPLEQVEHVIGLARGEEEVPEEVTEDELLEGEEVVVSPGEKPKLWLRPMAVSLIERGTRPLHVDDVVTDLEDDRLHVHAWIRTGGLRLVPFTLIDGPVDNPVAAQDFVEEVHERRTAVGFRPWALFDYWATWLAGGIGALVMLQQWRRKGDEKAEAEA